MENYLRKRTWKSVGRNGQTIETMRTQMRKNKPLDESRKSDQTSGTEMVFYSKTY
ncbi:hypothetical protein Hanom_Chr08g00714311 [Helianthus anomalus]